MLYLCDRWIDADECVGLFPLNVPPHLVEVFVLNLPDHAVFPDPNVAIGTVFGPTGQHKGQPHDEGHGEGQERPLGELIQLINRVTESSMD